jgi:hypothetical protein
MADSRPGAKRGRKVGNGSRQLPTRQETIDRYEGILVAIRETGYVKGSCAQFKITPFALRAYRRDNPAYNERYCEARREGMENLEDVAVKRARMSSDNLLMFLLKGAFPEKYGNRITGNGENGALVVQVKGGLPPDVE